MDSYHPADVGYRAIGGCQQVAGLLQPPFGPGLDKGLAGQLFNQGAQVVFAVAVFAGQVWQGDVNVIPRNILDDIQDQALLWIIDFLNGHRVVAHDLCQQDVEIGLNNRRMERPLEVVFFDHLVHGQADVLVVGKDNEGLGVAIL